MEREELPVDILFVGAGPANLAAAYHLARTLKEQGKRDEVEIAIIDKAQSIGAHSLSGAIMDPKAIAELFPEGWQEAGCPVEAKVGHEEVFHLSSGKAQRIPVPPMLKNHGNHVITLSDVVNWLKDKCEELEVMVFEGFPGQEFLYSDSGQIAGVRTMDKGLNEKGEPGPSFEPGADISARCVVLGEGPRGSLTKKLVKKFDLQGRNPQIYGTGCKEVWKLPSGRFAKGQVMHTSGWPLTTSMYGGSWIYGMDDDKVSIGFVTALDGKQPWLDPWENFQRWKSHAKIREILEGGEILKAGAKTIPEGGYWSRPKSYGDHFLIVGDSASMLNISRLKGIHCAIKSGMLASETILDALSKDDFSDATLQGYEDRFQASWLKTELYKTRNFRAEFKGGFWKGAVKAGVKHFLGGLGSEFKPVVEDHTEMLKLSAADAQPAALTYDGKYLIDKVTAVFHAGSVHEEHQPSHLHIADPEICATQCAEEYGNPCERFCPASVYEMIDDPENAPRKKMQINFSNCVHCKTCDIMDPYAIIEWDVPSDAGGPKYHGM